MLQSPFTFTPKKRSYSKYPKPTTALPTPSSSKSVSSSTSILSSTSSLSTTPSTPLCLSSSLPISTPKRHK
ncbi:hypothetical protein G210_4445, partial [Candida maltosa Xu316]